MGTRKKRKRPATTRPPVPSLPVDPEAIMSVAKTERITLRITPDQRVALDKAASALGMTLSDFAVGVIGQALEALADRGAI